jgi:hypothetical protein
MIHARQGIRPPHRQPPQTRRQTRARMTDSQPNTQVATLSERCTAATGARHPQPSPKQKATASMLARGANCGSVEAGQERVPDDR